ncbi:two pore calcium channel protein 1-like isoform X1 [Cloeon dipterum]|uniref:two pore calcium channel protein 1-like isoform X1 n=2 Tax=Cloeon dipterum TaxID=197152 RepID=UPI0032204F2E
MSRDRGGDISTDGYNRFHDVTGVSRLLSDSGRQRTPTQVSNEGTEFDEILQQDLVTNDLELAQLNSPQDEDKALWEMNYHEAAIFLEEGENNDKFDFHPKNPAALPAYLIVHSSWYHSLDLAASIVLLVLALAESPAIPQFELPILVHGAIELVALIVIGIEQAMKLRWLGWKPFLTHKRTAIKGLTLIIMVVEACVVIVRQSSHFRVTRALRPIFVIDNKYSGGVRRFVRQILQSLPPILDMLGMIMLMVALYSLLGLFLFGLDKDDSYFSSLPISFVSLFVLLTTANFPDVMMPSYAKSKWNSIFFISYISIVLYLLMNLLLAVVYEAFTSIEKDKFRKLLLHKREGAKRAFSLLVGPGDHSSVTFRRFSGLMKYFRPKKSRRDVLLTFKHLDVSGRGRLTLSEFVQIYEAVNLRWAPNGPEQVWFTSSQSSWRLFGKAAATIFDWVHFERVVFFTVVLNVLVMAFRIFGTTTIIEHSAVSLIASWDTVIFAGLFIVEACIRCGALGITRYFASGWNCYDFASTLLLVLSMTIVSLYPDMSFLVLSRPLRIIRVFKVKKRFRDVFGTLLLMMPRMSSAATVLLLLYFTFGIIGMELFSDIELKNCCVNSTVESYYLGKEQGGVALYYFISFSDLLASGVVLFHLSVVNNWHVTMEGYAVASGNGLSRLFFMLFNLVTMVVFTIVVASILGAFRFRIQYKEQTSKAEERHMLSVEVILHWEELAIFFPKHSPSFIAEEIGVGITHGGSTSFIGTRARTTEVLQMKMYKDDITKWLADEEEHYSPTLNSRLLQAEPWSSNLRVTQSRQRLAS